MQPCSAATARSTSTACATRFSSTIWSYLKTTSETFDVITADPIHPWAYGAAYLFTNEYYDLARARLNEGGVMCQWLPAYELSPPDFKSVITTFAQSFEHVVVWFATTDVVLVGSDTPIRIDLDRLSERLGSAAVQGQLTAQDVADPAAALLSTTGLYPVLLNFPEDAPDYLRRPGTEASITVFTDEGNPINMLASIVQWIGSKLAYL